MALILSIETATPVCSVALHQGMDLLSEFTSTESNTHSARLAPAIELVLKQAGFQPQHLDAVAVSCGPGSYTGLRIGLSTAKGLCYALDKPLITVPTLRAIAQNAVLHLPAYVLSAAYIMPMIDARRMEVYTALYTQTLDESLEACAMIIDGNSIPHDGANYILCGDGAPKCRPLFAHRDEISFLPIGASSVGVGMLAQNMYLQGHFADIAYSEPFYLKEFIAGKPIVKGLR